MDDLIPIIAILSVFGSITAICVLPGYFKHRTQREIQKTVRSAVSQGQQLPPEVIEVLTRDVKKGLPSRSRDIRRGVLFIAASVGVALLGLLSDASFGFGDGHFVGNGMLGVAAVPLMFGIAYLVLAAINKDKD